MKPVLCGTQQNVHAILNQFDENTYMLVSVRRDRNRLKQMETNRNR